MRPLGNQKRECPELSVPGIHMNDSDSPTKEIKSDAFLHQSLGGVNQKGIPPCLPS